VLRSRATRIPAINATAINSTAIVRRRLRESGVIEPEEFQREKDRILA
jgi:hypothetical protein